MLSRGSYPPLSVDVVPLFSPFPAHLGGGRGFHPQCLLAANDPFLRPSLPAAEVAAARAAAGAAAAAAVAEKALAAESGRLAVADDLGFCYGFASFSSISAPILPRSTVVPALLRHPARHEVQGAVLHILNEEGAARRALCRC